MHLKTNETYDFFRIKYDKRCPKKGLKMSYCSIVQYNASIIIKELFPHFCLTFKVQTILDGPQ